MGVWMSRMVGVLYASTDWPPLNMRCVTASQLGRLRGKAWNGAGIASHPSADLVL
jgi:hypothetical protein